MRRVLEGIESQLAAQAEGRRAVEIAARSIRHELAQVFLHVDKDLLVLGRIPGQAGLRQEPVVGGQLAGRELHLRAGCRQARDIAGGQVLLLHDHIVAGGLQAGLHARRQGQVRGDVPLVLHMQLHHIGLDRHVILGEGRIARHVIRGQVVVGGRKRIPAAARARGVALVPDAGLDLVIAQGPVQGRAQAGAVDAVFGGAGFIAGAAELVDDVGQAARGRGAAAHHQLREIDGEQAGQAGIVDRSRHHAAAGVMVEIGLVGPGDVLVDIPVILGIGQRILTLGGGVIVGEVVALRHRRGAGSSRVGLQRRDRARKVGILERPGIRDKAGGRSGLLVAKGGGVFVGLNLAVPVGIEGELARAGLVDHLQVQLVAMLVAVKIPGALVLVQVGQIAHPAVTDIAGVKADEAAAGVIAAAGLARINAEFAKRIAGEGFHSTAQIGGRSHAQRAGARRQRHAADILAGEGARRRQAVIVAILLVAQRHAVHGEAQLLGGEAMHHQRQVLLVVAPRIGGLIDHARQGFDRLQRTDAGQQLLRLHAAQAHRRMGAFAVGRDDDGFHVHRVFGAGGGGQRAECRCGEQHALQGAAHGNGHWKSPGEQPGVRRTAGIRKGNGCASLL